MMIHHLGMLDWAIVGLYFAAMVAIGLQFANRQKSTDHYFAGDRAVPAWAIGISVLATLISSATFLALPGEGYARNWTLLVQGLMVPVVLLPLVWFIVPCYRRVIGLSAYEYFERRFGALARVYAALEFSLMHFAKMATGFYLLTLALTSMTGVDPYQIIVVVGIVTVLYTWVGGIEAVVWTDVVQAFLFLIGGIVVMAVLLFRPEGGPAAVVGLAWENHKMSLGSMDLDFTRLTFVVMATNGLFYALQKYATDQTIVQRFLLAKSDREAVKASLLGPLLCVPTWALFIFIGTCLWSFYQITGLPLPPGAVAKPEAVFPHFIMTQLPPGVIGLILSALLAAAMSTLASDLNCLAVVGMEDFYRRIRPRCTDRERLLTGKAMVCIFGVLAMGASCLYLLSEGRTVLDIVFSLFAVFSGGIAGLFALAFFTVRANRKGATVGIAVCVAFTAYAFLTSTTYAASGGRRLFVDLGEYNFPHHVYMLGVYSHLVLFGVGYLASLPFRSEASARELTIYGWLDRRRRRRSTGCLADSACGEGGAD
jgi:solute:Na+ symporter, SSS family